MMIVNKTEVHSPSRALPYSWEEGEKISIIIKPPSRWKLFKMRLPSKIMKIFGLYKKEEW